MKKKLLLLTGALTVAALSVAIFAHKPMTAEEALLLKNVEAIAQNEGGGSDCTNPNGYAKWETGRKYGFNDCCGNQVTGGDPVFGCRQ